MKLISFIIFRLYIFWFILGVIFLIPAIINYGFITGPFFILFFILSPIFIALLTWFFTELISFPLSLIKEISVDKVKKAVKNIWRILVLILLINIIIDYLSDQYTSWFTIDSCLLNAFTWLINFFGFERNYMTEMLKFYLIASAFAGPGEMQGFIEYLEKKRGTL